MTVSSADLVALLRLRHPPPEWVFATELQRPGTKAGRRIDAAAFNAYPSKRGRTVAYEVKVCRSDFMRELENPDKRHEFTDAFTEFYFVVPSGLVDPDEVPEGCGLLMATSTGSRLIRKRAAHQSGLDGEGDYWHLLAAARQLATEVVELRERVFRIDGEEITKERLVEIVEKRTTAERKRVEREVSRLRDAQETARRRSEAVGYLKNLARSGWTGAGEPVTREDVDDIIERAAANRVKNIFNDHTLRRLRDDLGSLLEAWEEAPEVTKETNL